MDSLEKLNNNIIIHYNYIMSIFGEKPQTDLILTIRLNNNKSFFAILWIIIK
jgi:hypothetical protein